jgi:hypothetical protein
VPRASAGRPAAQLDRPRHLPEPDQRRPGRSPRNSIASTLAYTGAAAPHVQLDLTEMEPEESLPAMLHGETDVAVANEYDLLPRPLDPLFERHELALGGSPRWAG